MRAGQCCRHGQRHARNPPHAVTVFVAAGSAALAGGDLLAHRVATSLTIGTVMLAIAFVLVVALIARPRTGVRGAVCKLGRRPPPATGTPVPAVEDALSERADH